MAASSDRRWPLLLIVSGTLLLACVADPAQAFSQATPMTNAADELKAGFHLYSDTSDYASAAQHFQTALTRAVEEKHRWVEAEAHRGLGIVNLEMDQYAPAGQHLRQALAIFEELKDRLAVARVRVHLGSLARATGDSQQARELFQLALADYRALGEHRETARVLLRLAMAAEEAVQADQFSAEGLQFAREAGDRVTEGQLLHNWGDRSFSLGKFAEAWPKYELAAACFEPAGARSDLARVYVSMGRLLRAHGRPERSLEYYRRALAIQEQLGDQQGVVQAINAMAVAYQNLHDYDAALERYSRALELAREIGSPRAINFQLGNLANAEIAAGHWTQGAALLQTLLAAAPKMDPSTAAYRYAALSQAHVHFRRYEEALLAAEEAVRYARQTKNVEFLPLVLATRATAHHKAGKTRDAIADLSEAMKVIEQLRTRVLPADFLKRGFGEVHQSVFGSAIEFLFEDGQYQAALEVAERARARAFVDLLASKGIDPASRQPASAGNRGDQRETFPTAAAGPPRVVKREPREVSTSVFKDLLSPDLQLASSSFVAPPSVEAMQAIAQRLHSTILTYWTTPESTFVWCIPPHGRIRAKRLPLSSRALAALVRQTRGSGASAEAAPSALRRSKAGSGRVAAQQSLLHSPGGTSIALKAGDHGAWEELYKILVAPVRNWLPLERGSLVTIVPHGPLLLLSFAALRDEHHRYLVEDYTLHYVPAISMLQFTGAEAPSHQQSRGYLFLADPSQLPSDSEDTPLPRLAGARHEVESIKRLLPMGNVTVLEGRLASEERLRSNVAGKKVIHFATHAILRDADPMESFLALASSSPSKDSDGRLTADEIYKISIDADLVVLSACRTSAGSVSGDGIVGLTRAFFYAGTRSVLGTVWDVADDPSSRLLPSFYRSWLQLHNKSRALRQAQLALLRDLRENRVWITTPLGKVILPEDPSLWGGYVLQGEP